MTSDKVDWELSNLQCEQRDLLMLLNLTFPLIPLEITFFLEIKHLQIKRLLVKLESQTFFLKLSRGAYQRASYCTCIVI